MILDASKSQLLIVDMQEKLLPAMVDPDRVVGRAALLLEAAREMNIPRAVSEQYPKGLGATTSQLQAQIEGVPVLEKLHFSCARDPALAELLHMRRETGCDQVVVAGIEAHVCVGQTVLDLMERGFVVAVAADAISSRRTQDCAVALARFAAAGASVTTTEAVVFEWLEKAGTSQFKALSALIKPL
ncbi:MAG: isochorismatase family protein [Alphaproteobacteria bacterium]